MPHLAVVTSHTKIRSRLLIVQPENDGVRREPGQKPFIRKSGDYRTSLDGCQSCVDAIISGGKQGGGSSMQVARFNHENF